MSIIIIFFEICTKIIRITNHRTRAWIRCISSKIWATHLNKIWATHLNKIWATHLNKKWVATHLNKLWEANHLYKIKCKMPLKDLHRWLIRKCSNLVFHPKTLTVKWAAIKNILCLNLICNTICLLKLTQTFNNMLIQINNISICVINNFKK